ncbi:MAG TPA: hypothetical protein VKX17_20675 [Planctomycetota bacterium]|nr:hypothetical protein [Planctomycetota bacterium]
MDFPAYICLLVALIGLSYPAVRLSKKSKSMILAVVVNVLALIPGCILLWMRSSGVSATLQMNVGDNAAMDFWSVWVKLCPLLFLEILACLALSAVAGVVYLVMCFIGKDWKSAGLPLTYLMLTIGHCLFVLHWLSENLPDA